MTSYLIWDNNDGYKGTRYLDETQELQYDFHNTLIKFKSINKSIQIYTNLNTTRNIRL